MTQPAPEPRNLPAGGVWRAMAVFVFSLLAVLSLAGTVFAQTDPPNQAGLVVRFGDGRVATACVDLGPDGEMTGEELLAATGLQPVIEYTALGGTVCEIGAQGCGYPEEACWCQCKGGPTCVYWQYYHLTDGEWVYATIGASLRTLHAGDIDGWSWGEGEGADGVEPPLMTLDEICAADDGPLFTPIPEDMLAAGTAAALTTPVNAAEAPKQPAAPPAVPAIDADESVPMDDTAPPGIVLFAGVLIVLGAGAAGVRVASSDAAPRRPRTSHNQTAGHRTAAAISLLIYGLSTVIGVAALLYPFLAAALRPATGQPSSLNGPGLMLVLLGVCFAGLLLEVQGQAVSTKLIALLGVLVAINSVLRFVEVGIPGPGGFSPVFVLIILTGYVFGGQFGFLMGALTMLVSAVFTGGIGPWLPAQMFAAGWVGLSAPLARPLVRLAGGQQGSRREVAILAVFAGVWGLLFGAIMNLWFWPFIAGPADQYWQAGISVGETLRRYLAYYLVTSLFWDTLRVAGNVALMLVFGAATLRALRRFGQRFSFEYQPEFAASPVPDTGQPRQRGFSDPGSLRPGSSQS
ncbi:MAG: ECF transporter S component [Caldilineae bacterium]|nr:ECF transporter S component [Caldilineae bacterium]